MNEVNAAIDGVDVAALIVDASEEFGGGNRRAVERLQRFEGRRFLLLNKVDRIPKSNLLPLIEKAAKLGQFDEIIPISALKGEGVDLLLKKLIEYIPAGAPQFPADQYTDGPAFLAAEIIREKQWKGTSQVPHAVAVLIDSFGGKLLGFARPFTWSATKRRSPDRARRRFLEKSAPGAEGNGRNFRREGFLQDQPREGAENWRDNPQIVRQLDWHRARAHVQPEQE